MSQSITVLSMLFVSLVTAGPMNKYPTPTVKLDDAVVTGVSSGSVSEFLGIPYAQPPTGNLRFRLPEPLPPYSANFSATTYGPSCLQQKIQLPDLSVLPPEVIDYLTEIVMDDITFTSEDCLTLNVVTPADATPDSELPVVVWVYGGGFETGGTALYNGSVIVNRAMALGVPAVYVSMNYRLNAFGFLASQEVKDAGVGNLGLQDQRSALRWVQKYISAFGGDPKKVTIWGESAGAVSVSLQMVANDGNTDGLFRAAFMQSGSPIPVGDISHGQEDYDALVQDTGCSAASDTLQCLREVPYTSLLSAVYKRPSIVSYEQPLELAWIPRADGVFLTDNPQYLVQRGCVANVPFISGVCDDEGTVFALSNLNITTEKQLEEYIQTYLLPDAPPSTTEKLLELYPADITEGSPFNTGIFNAITPEFKRIAAIKGDAVFQAPRRFFLQSRSGKQSLWTFVSKRFKTVPVLGSFHVSDLVNVYGGEDMTSYLVRFVSNLDPNGAPDIYWPQYTTAEPDMLAFLDGPIPQVITEDTFREEAIEFVVNVSLAYPV